MHCPRARGHESLADLHHTDELPDLGYGRLRLLGRHLVHVTSHTLDASNETALIRNII